MDSSSIYETSLRHAQNKKFHLPTLRLYVVCCRSFLLCPKRRAARPKSLLEGDFISGKNTSNIYTTFDEAVSSICLAIQCSYSDVLRCLLYMFSWVTTSPVSGGLCLDFRSLRRLGEEHGGGSQILVCLDMSCILHIQ